MNINLSISIKDFNDFKSACNHFGIEINNNQLDLFKKYYEILLEWNKKINLISRKEDNVLVKHFLDSIIFLPEINDLANRAGARPVPTVFDIGSGGGFPAVPLAIMKPDWHFTLCESIKKKAIVLSDIINELELKNVIVINNRVENVRALHATPQQYDIITARAVGKLDELIKYALPLLKENGYLIAYKSKDIEDEIKNVCTGKVTLPLQIFEKEIHGITRKLVTIRHCEEGL